MHSRVYSRVIKHRIIFPRPVLAPPCAQGGVGRRLGVPDTWVGWSCHRDEALENRPQGGAGRRKVGAFREMRGASAPALPPSTGVGVILDMQYILPVYAASSSLLLVSRLTFLQGIAVIGS